MAEEKEKESKLSKFLELKLSKARDPRYQVVEVTRPESRILVDFANQLSFFITIMQRTEYTRTAEEDQIYTEFKSTFKKIVAELDSAMVQLQPLLDKMPTIKGRKKLKISSRGQIKAIIENEKNESDSSGDTETDLNS